MDGGPRLCAFVAMLTMATARRAIGMATTVRPIRTATMVGRPKLGK
jgi:hypothetical protein